MSKAWNVVRRLGKDEEGASLIEYTVLLGILLVAVIATPKQHDMDTALASTIWRPAASA